MLEAARRELLAGRDVVIGCVDSHGSADVEGLARALPRLPCRDAEPRGAPIPDFDLAAALSRRPALLLLDDLARSNAPGATHASRWQDAHDLLDAGVDVWTTLNVQHLESLSDLIAQVTGVKVRDTVPDRIFDEADEIEFVDVSPEELLVRFAEGKAVLPDQPPRAVRQFFRKGNLIALRELALRRAADRLDGDVQEYRRDHAIETTWPVAERILVGIRPNPESDRLVRAGKRMAAGLRADWIVAYVESPAQPPLSARERESLSATLKLAERLGAEVAVISGESVAAALIEFARERNASKIVVGKPSHPRWRDRLRGSLLDDVVRRSSEIDVYTISGDALERPPAEPVSARRRSPGRNYVWAALTVVACTLVCSALYVRFDRSNLVMVYLLGVAFVATRFGRGPSLLATTLGVAAFDFFFVPPYLTFAVADTQYVVTFAVMLVVGLLVSTLAARVREQAEAARQREKRARTLYALSRELAGARRPEDVASVASRHVAELFRGAAAVLLPGPDGSVDTHFSPAEAIGASANEQAAADWVFQHGRPAGLGTDTVRDAAALYLPLRGDGATLAVLRVRPHETLLPLAPEQMDLIETLAHVAAGALQRVKLAQESEAARVAAESERLRSTLLSSVSHDLRTPLAAITGAASSLLQEPTPDSHVRRELTATVYEEAERLNRLVTNLLDMTRLEAGAPRLNRDWQSLEEIVGSAVAQLERKLVGRAVTTELASDLPLLFVDATLVERVIVNLLENALKYAPGATPIELAARFDRAAGAVTVEVRDEGPGLPPGSEQRLFEKFERGHAQPGGFGLGLAICRAIVSAHGGRIWAENQQPRGARFAFALPAGAPPPTPGEDQQ
jgi:two-component system sensor histidine kinase KdpD